MTLTKSEVEHIAGLARIKLTETEKEKIAEDLSHILGYIERLNEIDTTSIEPISQITGLENVFRKDESYQADDGSREAVIDQFPHKKDDYLKVKPVFEDKE
jgi:aspartyl-tRNA(Asn)/glutamyl-tRNA(Gln) amidotransferase subunit C